MEFQDREGRNDSLKLGFEEYLKKDKTKKQKASLGGLLWESPSARSG